MIRNLKNNNIMKKITIAILTLLLSVSGSLFAQGKYGKDSAECLKYLSYYREYYKQKAYDDALPNWRMPISYARLRQTRPCL
jgi:uncharacterized protein YxeA